MYDIIIRNPTVYDGSGNRPFSADIGISKDKITFVGDLSRATASNTIDARALAVMPGCIDAHSHSDLTLPTHNRAESSIRQGITTEVAGSCGWSMAPNKKETVHGVLKYLIEALAGPEEFKNTDWNWHTFDEFLKALEDKRIATNLVPVVGQSLIRAHVVGTDDRPASKAEIDAMKSLLQHALKSGAFGLSTGRSYEPGGFADIEEIIELARVVSDWGGVYTIHMKDEGDGLMEAVEEAIEIGRRTGVSVLVSHHKAIGRANFGKVKQSLEMLQKARDAGVNISCDVYPYNFAQISFLWRIFPRAIQDLGEQTVAERLADATFKDEVRALDKLERVSLNKSAAEYLVVGCPGCREAEWKTLADIASGKDIVDVICDLLLKSRMKAKYAAMMDETDVQTVLRNPMTMVGTDAFTLDRELGGNAAIHPRHNGTFPRVLGHYVRDVGLMRLEEMVRKVTSMPATKFGLFDRGRIETGFAADLLVFDPNTIIDLATAEEPYKQARGIHYVLVNGQITLENGNYAPVLAGKVLRKRRFSG